jgi:hypothetical protein
VTPVKSTLGWREPILKHFTPEIAEAVRLTIVADPDQLLTEQEILVALRDRGFDLVPFEDHAAFRYAYESKYRQVWDQGDRTNLVVALKSAAGSVDALPYDLLVKARSDERCLSFSVGELFPTLSPNVVSALDRQYFDGLYEALKVADSKRLGLDDSKDFVLRHVFEVAPELIKTPASLLQVLLRRHYRGMSFPEILDQRFIQLLKKDGRWRDWPLDLIVPSRVAFLEFLDERWPHFLERVAKGKEPKAGEAAAAYGLKHAGPVEIPFDHDDIKVYIDNLFQEGQLHPIGGYSTGDLPEQWMHVGIISSAEDDRQIRFERLSARLESEFPPEDAKHGDWVEFARTWGEWAALRWEIGAANTGVPAKDLEDLHDRIEETFGSWVTRAYGSLHNLSHSNRPAMVHHIPRHLAQSFVATGGAAAGSGRPSRHALIVVDGMGMDQWVVLRDALVDKLGDKARIQEDGTFAWVPTLTSVSRQAIFAGQEPLFFGASIRDTSKEKAHWSRFWEDKGAAKIEIGYVKEGKNQPDEAFLEEVIKVAEHPKMRVLGIVVGKIDQAMHGITTGTSGLHAIVRDWAKSGAFSKLVETLLDAGYELAITSDHGNIHGSGIGKPKVGAIADERGERVHVFSDELTRDNAAKPFPATIAWPQIGLPDGYHALIASGRGAFVPEGRQTVGHGGIAMEEVIVPFVKISKGIE